MPDAATTASLQAWAFAYLLHSTGLLGVVWALARSRIVRDPATLDLLWKTAALGAVVTSVMAPSSSSGAFPDQPRHVEVRTLVERTVHPGTSLADGPAERTHVRVETVRSGPPPSRGLWLALLWLAGAVLGMIRVGAGWRAARGVCRDGRPARSAHSRTLRAFLPPGLRAGVAVIESDRVSGPCVMGTRAVALPERWGEGLACDDLRAVLAHEAAHILRADAWWSLALRTLAAVFWVQPLNRLALAGCQAAAELACDDWAVLVTGRPLGLARSIERVASGVSHPGIPTPALAASGSGDVVARVARLTAPRSSRPAPGRWWRVALAAGLLALAPALSAWVPRPASALEVDVGTRVLSVEHESERTVMRRYAILVAGGGEPRTPTP